MLEAVLFDVGNTLLYLDYARLQRVLGEAGVLPAALTGPDALARVTLAERRARVVLSRYLLESGASTEDPLTFRRYLALALAELDLSFDEAHLESAFARLCVEHRRENFFSVTAPGALEAVAALAERFKLAVVSNAGGKVAPMLAARGFGRHLLAVMDSGLIGIEKPDPRIFLMACEHAGVRPEDAVYVGDLHAIDVVGARNAGLRPALLDPAGAYATNGVTDALLVTDVAALADHLLS